MRNFKRSSILVPSMLKDIIDNEKKSTEYIKRNTDEVNKIIKITEKYDKLKKENEYYNKYLFSLKDLFIVLKELFNLTIIIGILFIVCIIANYSQDIDRSIYILISQSVIIGLMSFAVLKMWFSSLRKWRQDELKQAHQFLFKNIGYVYHKMLFLNSRKKSNQKIKEFIKELTTEENAELLLMVDLEEIRKYMDINFYSFKREMFKSFYSFYKEEVKPEILKKYTRNELNCDKDLTENEQFVLSNLGKKIEIK